VTTSATVLADSVNQYGDRLTTFELVMPRFVLPQFNKHASIRSCAQSSRAIPFSKLLALATYVPNVFGKNQRGMSPGEGLDKGAALDARAGWNDAKAYATMRAEDLARLGVHKQWVNRLLEPFSYVKVVATATEWKLFFRLRCAPDAQDEMQELANAMKEAMNTSVPRVLGIDDWHLPYLKQNENIPRPFHYTTTARVSAARCARTSYLTHTGEHDVFKDAALADELIKNRHLTPIEMPARPAVRPDEWYGAYKGWISLRHELALLNDRLRLTQTWREIDE
jgi:thymidylate synthase ThyX